MVFSLILLQAMIALFPMLLVMFILATVGSFVLLVIINLLRINKWSIRKIAEYSAVVGFLICAYFIFRMLTFSGPWIN